MRRGLMAAVITLVLAAQISGAPIAHASVQQECDLQPFTSERCYALLISDTVNYGAEHTTVVRDALVYNPAEMFVFSSMWIGMSDGWWVEVGYGEGESPCGSFNSPHWYTARLNSNGYQETCLSGLPAVGSSHLVSVQRLASPTTSWQVRIDGVLRYTHTAMKTWSTTMHQGVEANHWATRLNHGWHSGYRHKTTTSTWAPSIWPNTYPVLIGTPSAYGTVTAPYAVWDHGFWGV